MLFSSISFLYYFLPIVLLIYYVVPNKFRNYVLLGASIVFYFLGEPKYVFLMIGSCFSAWLFAYLMDKYPSHKKTFFISSIVISIGLLCIFKYTDFILENINTLINGNIQLLNLALPIGISFYTFQILSYTIDVYNGKVPVQKSFVKLATYVSLFPQLIAGPIVRYETIEHDLDNRTHSFEKFALGVRRFVLGLAKKVIIANSLGKICSIFLASSSPSVVYYWLYAVSYMLQIYFDFSAYSDMAIGLGKMFGFEFLENFDYPYLSKSITEFWRRWHMSLDSWFRDYVYIPMGGSRVGKLKLFRNIFVVWFLTGMWHGANWTFIIWGLMFGVLLVFEKFILNKIIDKIPNIIRHLYVLFIVLISFIIFNADNMNVAFTQIRGLFGVDTVLTNKESLYYLNSNLFLIIISIVLATPLIKNIVIKLNKNKVFEKIFMVLEPIVLVSLLIVVTSYLVSNSYNPFLYFRF